MTTDTTQPEALEEVNLSDQAKVILEHRYLLKNTNSEIVESPTELFRRVAKAVASIDSDYISLPVEASLTEKDFFTIMKNLEFEKMSPGMMGYNQGGKVMSTYDKLKAIADNNYG